MLLEQLRHLSNSNLDCTRTRVTGPTIHYRRRARLAVKYLEKKEELLIGFHEKQGGYINRIESCVVLHAAVGKKIVELKQLIRSLTIYQYIAQIEVACGSTLVAIVLRNLLPFASKDMQLLEEFSQKYRMEIYGQSGGIESVKLIVGSGKPLSYDLDNSNIKMFFAPTDFIQINQWVNEQLVNLVMELLELRENDTVLDLFCGIGNFTLPIAKRVKQVVGVEGMVTAVTRAQQNALHNNLTNATFYTADLEKDFQEQSWWQNIYDKILLDPPRTGAEELCAHLAKLQVKKIIYVSCNAATLARDVGILQNNGYRLLTVSIADMYPHTKHLEIVAELVG
jgi:23S rRNA (uracil1939-C5)-methyltransferase